MAGAQQVKVPDRPENRIPSQGGLSGEPTTQLRGGRTTYSSWQQTRDALATLLDLEKEERALALARIASARPELGEELEALLLAGEIEAGVLERPVGELLPKLTEESCRGSADDIVPTDPRVDGWNIGLQLGRGGMGTVYLAERPGDGFTQVGALKVTQARHGASSIEDRMRTERRALARLEHPAIARLIDAGLAADGRPFVVMERVKGTRVDHYCDQHGLAIEARVSLFCDICSAVDFAHRHLVIHCDLKPSNVLVDEDGRVKLLDFGIAKIVGDPEDSRAEGLSPLTPTYASPEQLSGQPASVASDVYSLGVILWQLLAGVTPEGETQSSVCAPSQTLYQIDKTVDSEGRLSQVAQARSIKPKALLRALRGDLDAILLRSTAEHSDERYQTAAALADDLRRWQERRPVRARRVPLLGHFRLFAQRNPALTGSVALVLVTVAVAAVMLVVANGRVVAERQLAMEEAARSRGALAFLESALTPSAPALQQGAPLTLADLLIDAEQRLEQELADQPEVHMELLRFLSNHYLSVALYDRAVKVSEDAVALLQASNLELSGSTFERAMNPARARETVLVLNRNGYCLIRAARFAEAAVVLERSVRIAEEHLTADSVELREALRYTSYLVGVRTPKETVVLRSRILELERQRSNGAPSASLARALDDHGRSLHIDGRLDEAIRELQEAVTMRREVGEPDVEVANSMANLAAALSADGQGVEAEANARGALVLIEASTRPEPHATAKALVQLAIALSIQERLAEAASAVERAVAIYDSMGVSRQVAKAEALRVAGGVACLDSQFQLGLDLAVRSLEVLVASYPQGDWRVARGQATLGLCELWSGATTAAQATGRLEAALESLEESLGVRTPLAISVREALSAGTVGEQPLPGPNRPRLP